VDPMLSETFVRANTCTEGSNPSLSASSLISKYLLAPTERNPSSQHRHVDHRWSIIRQIIATIASGDSS